jgi:hypothetical protein
MTKQFCFDKTEKCKILSGISLQNKKGMKIFSVKQYESKEYFVKFFSAVWQR